MKIRYQPRSQLGWLVALWLMGVAAMGVFAGAMHAVMAVIGLAA